MSIGKKVLLAGVLLFGGIWLAAVLKKDKVEPPIEEWVSVETLPSCEFPVESSVCELEMLPRIDRIEQLFSTKERKLPIVETVTYTSKAPWLKGRPAWLADYAAYYNTSKHFIARSLTGRAHYMHQNIQEGERFNVFRKDKKIEFHLVADLSRLQMALYYVDLQEHERVLIKVYAIGAGRLDPSTTSGFLTPFGCYQLGDKVSLYQPGVMGFFHEQKTEMIRIFGTRWIPFSVEIAGCTEPAKGYGIHGAPWVVDQNRLVEHRDCIGKYESDGCIRLVSEDMEELFAVVITKPTFLHSVKKFEDAVLPGIEVTGVEERMLSR